MKGRHGAPPVQDVTERARQPVTPSPAARVAAPAPTTPQGPPHNLRRRVEALSGLDLRDVRVHRRSPHPEHLDAAAFTRGSEVHLGPDQEHHLGHELWHVVQQRQGRVRPTTRIGDHGVNDEEGLEREADEMARLASRAHGPNQGTSAARHTAEDVAAAPKTPAVQRRGPSLRSRVAKKLERANSDQTTATLSRRERRLAPELARGRRAGFTPELLRQQRARLRTQRLVPAMARTDSSSHDRMSLNRQRGQSPESFTDFMVDTRRSLGEIDSRPHGSQLLDELSDPHTGVRSRVDDHSSVIISDARMKDKPRNTAGPEPDRTGLSFQAYRSGIERSSESGDGLAAHVAFNPDIVHPRTEQGVSDGPRPAFMGLAHELVHAHRFQRGLGVDPDEQLGRALEEAETVGMTKSPSGFNENVVRDEHGLPKRTTYGGADVRTLGRRLQEEGLLTRYLKG